MTPMSGTPNPYASPATDDALPPPTATTRSGRARWADTAAWCLVCLLNVPVCFVLAISLLASGGYAGVALGVLLIMAAVAVAISQFTMLAKVVIRGSLLFALTQCYPILQMFAGIAAVSATEFLSGGGVTLGPDGGQLGLWRAAFTTVVTGGLLLIGAVAAGVVLKAVTPTRWWAEDATRQGAR